jgi:hypothetical protein
MDHIARIGAPTSDLIKVSYYKASQYDGGDFSSYPTRRKFNLKDLSNALNVSEVATVSAEHVSKLNSLVQEWLFFGLLQQIFKAID